MAGIRLNEKNLTYRFFSFKMIKKCIKVLHTIIYPNFLSILQAGRVELFGSSTIVAKMAACIKAQS